MVFGGRRRGGLERGVVAAFLPHVWSFIHPFYSTFNSFSWKSVITHTSRNVVASATMDNLEQSETRVTDKVEKKRAPTKPVSPFFRFSASTRHSVKKANPDLTPEQVKEKVAVMWSELSEEDKKPYYDLLVKDEEKYKIAKAEWDAGEVQRTAAADVENPRPTSQPASRPASKARKAKAGTIECPHCHGTIQLQTGASLSSDEDSDHEDPPEEVIIAGVRNIGLSTTFEDKFKELEARFPPKEPKSRAKK